MQFLHGSPVTGQQDALPAQAVDDHRTLAQKCCGLAADQEAMKASLGEKPEQTTCYVAQGLQEEHDHFVSEKPSEDVLTLFNLGAATKTEHYEIAVYTGLIEQATLMGHTEAAKLLQQNLKQEQATLKKVEQLCSLLGKRQIKAAGQEDMSQSASK